MMYINTMVALSANTPGADGSLVEWALFIFNKYSTLFLKATWVTLYVALIGTLLGFILGFAVGIINTVKIHKEDNIIKKILLRVLRVIVVIYVEIFRDTPMIVQAMLYIIVPQALKNVIPEMCNTFVNNLKMTSVLNVIGVSELFLMAKTAGGAYYKYFESYIVISIIYFIMCFVFNRLFAVVEKKLQGRSDYELATEYLEND